MKDATSPYKLCLTITLAQRDHNALIHIVIVLTVLLVYRYFTGWK